MAHAEGTTLAVLWWLAGQELLQHKGNALSYHARAGRAPCVHRKDPVTAVANSFGVEQVLATASPRGRWLRSDSAGKAGTQQEIQRLPFSFQDATGQEPRAGLLADVNSSDPQTTPGNRTSPSPTVQDGT